MSDILDGSDTLLHHGDGILFMPMLPDTCIDLAIFSPPFPALFAYTSEPGDIGNSEDLKSETKLHLSFFYRQLARLIKPGRVVIVHVMQIPRMKRAGGRGLCDFRGMNIRLAERAGLVFTYDWLVTKNPQKQAIRTRSRELQFAGLESDRAHSRGCLGDYLLKFETHGNNAVAVDSEGEVSRSAWIDWAESAWTDILEQDTLNVSEGRDAKDVKHICPLQLEIYRRMILMFTNPGEIVLDPFMGLGSGGFMALGGESPKTHKSIEEPRRFVGCELKDSYFATAGKNLDRARKQRKLRQKTMWNMEPVA
jgi:hypothetical protein